MAVVAVLAATTSAAAARRRARGRSPTGQIRVVIVVDPGDAGPRGPMATCLVVNAGTSGSQILAQRAVAARSAVAPLRRQRPAVRARRLPGDGLPREQRWHLRLLGLLQRPSVAPGPTATTTPSSGAWSTARSWAGATPPVPATTAPAPGPRMAPSSSLFPALTPRHHCAASSRTAVAPAPGRGSERRLGTRSPGVWRWGRSGHRRPPGGRRRGRPPTRSSAAGLRPTRRPRIAVGADGDRSDARSWPRHRRAARALTPAVGSAWPSPSPWSGRWASVPSPAPERGPAREPSSRRK